MNPILRRTLLAAGPLALAGCRAAEGAYFGKTDPPNRQTLVAVLGVEPGALDPATSAELIEQRVIYALFEGLTTLHPSTGEAMAGMATHYQVTPDGLRYTFYLRGHPAPRGSVWRTETICRWSFRTAYERPRTPCRHDGATACRSPLKTSSIPGAVSSIPRPPGRLPI